MKNDFIIKDSGKRTEHKSGMVRDTAEGKTDWERIFNGPMAERWAVHLTKGCVKYPDVGPGVPNWTLADSEVELMRAKKSACRHFAQWMRGDSDEDHAAGVFFNINQVEYIKGRLRLVNHLVTDEKKPSLTEGFKAAAKEGKTQWFKLPLPIFVGIMVGLLLSLPVTYAGPFDPEPSLQQFDFDRHNDLTRTTLRELQLQQQLDRSSSRHNPC